MPGVLHGSFLGCDAVTILARVRPRGEVKITHYWQNGKLRDGALVIFRRLPAIERCYQGELTSQPYIFGSVSFRLDVGTDGRVTIVRITQGRGPDHALVSCVSRELEGAAFDPPEKVVTIGVGITFQQVPPGP